MQNYFQLYHIPLTFKPDKAAVKQAYFQLCRKYHPDFFGNSTEDEKQEALEMSSVVNTAFKTFCDEEATIKYVLELKGILTDEEKYVLSNDFLMEMMEWNEKLMDAKLEGDKDLIDECKNAIKNMQLIIYESVKEIIEKDTESDFSEKKLLQIKDYYFKKKYLNRILDGID